MRLENQVTSLEISKKLKELGVKQESLFYWVEYEKDAYDLWHKIAKEVYFTHTRTIHSLPLHNLYSAYTVAELGELLPYEWKLTFKSSENSWWVSPRQDIPHCWAKTEANARAKMLIYLIENKLIKLTTQKIKS